MVLVGITTNIEETKLYWHRSLSRLDDFKEFGPFNREEAEELKLKKVELLKAAPLPTTLFSSCSKYKWWVYTIKQNY